MLGSTVLNAVLTYLRKDKRGLALSIDEFNYLSPIIDKRVLKTLTKNFEDNIDSSSETGFLKVSNWPLTLQAGVTALPSNYYRMMGDPYYTDSGGTRRNIDVVTSMERSYREVDYLTKSTLTHPTAVIGSSSTAGLLQVRVMPTTIASIYVNYLRMSNVPFLDYYMDNATLQPTYMIEGETVSMAAAYTYRDGTVGVKASTTVDWEWGADELPLIVAYFLEAIGAVIPDTLMREVGSYDKNDIEQ